jgi:hypothetical protein
MRASRLAPLALVTGLLLAGCSTSTDPGPSSASTNPAAPPTGAGPTAGGTAGTPGPVAADEAWAHVHNLTLDGDRLLIGTHEGLWSQQPGQPAEQVSAQAFDVMGFAQAGDMMYASGHPGDGQDAPADLGLQTSTDAGKTWSTVSLDGQVDFHRIRADDTVIQGLSAHDGKFLRSTDAGKTWADLGTPPLFDFALDPKDPEHLIATQQTGPVRSTDGGATFEPIPEVPLLAFLAWTGNTLYAIATDGSVQASTDSGDTWTQLAQLEGQPQALAADGAHVVALAGTTIWESTDSGKTFTPRVTGIADS